MSDSYLQTVVLIGAGVVGLAVMVLVAGTVVGTAFDIAEAETVESSLDIASGEAALPQPSQNRTYQQSLGTALQFDGSGSLSATDTVSLDDTAELCTHARIRDTGANQTLAAADGDLTLRYAGNGTSDWVGTWYDRRSRELYDVRTAAGTPGDLTALCVRTDGANLTLAVNATDQPPTSIDGTGTDPSLDYGALNGTVEETRVFDRTLNASERTALYTTPTAPLQTPAQARIMFDTRASAPGSIPVYFTGQSATIDGGVAVDGYAGQSISAGSDYQEDGGDFVVADGGRLDQAPVVFTTFERPGGPLTSVFTALSSIGTTALTLLVIGLLVIGAGRVQEAMDGF